MTVEQMETGDALLSPPGEGRKNSSNDSSSYDSDSSTERHQWASKREYVLTMVGYCVGLGNIWRFPYVCMKNGGGAFLIPFIISLIVCGMPCFFLESAMGQFLGKSSWHAWCICPLFKGIGISMNILSIVCSTYYTMILGYTIIYIVNCFKSPLPWTLCDQSWNTPNCFAPRAVNISDSNMTTSLLSTVGLNGTISELGNNLSSLAFDNQTYTTVTDNVGNVSSTEEFWLRNVLELSPSLEELNGIPWATGLSLFAANALVLIGIIKGVQTSGKVVYVTASLPYFLLTVIIILGCTLEGAGDGVLFYLKPDFSKLMTLQPWMQAVIQVFYSLGTGWGAIPTMASYNKFNNNVMKDSIILTLCCEGTSVYGGFAIFTILGHMAYKAGVHISNYAKSGAGLVFVVYPEAISYLPLPQLWAFLFFLMLLLLGLDSAFSSVETSITVVADLWPRFVSKWRILISTGVMLCYSFIGLIFASRGGMYWFQLADWYIAAFALLLQATIECVVIGWIYGMDKFSRDIELMIGRKPLLVFILAWKYITPVLLFVLWILTLAYYEPPTFEGQTYPAYAQAIGWFIASAPFAVVVVYAIYEISRHPGTLKQRLQKATTATSEWAPALPEARAKYHTAETEMLNDLHSSSMQDCKV